MTRLVPLLIAMIFGLAPPPLAAQEKAAGEKPGRYTMTPIDGGFLRLDTETGAISQCTRPKGADPKGTTRTCAPANDTARDEAAKLKAENKKLEGDVRRLEEMVIGDPKAGPPPPSAGSRPQAQLPSEQEIDRAIDELERLFRKYRDRVREFDRNLATPAPGGAPKPPPPVDASPAPKSL